MDTPFEGILLYHSIVGNKISVTVKKGRSVVGEILLMVNYSLTVDYDTYHNIVYLEHFEITSKSLKGLGKFILCFAISIGIEEKLILIDDPIYLKAYPLQIKISRHIPEDYLVIYQSLLENGFLSDLQSIVDEQYFSQWWYRKGHKIDLNVIKNIPMYDLVIYYNIIENAKALAGYYSREYSFKPVGNMINENIIMKSTIRDIAVSCLK